MNRAQSWGAPVRTQAMNLGDVVQFLTSARDEAVMAQTPERLAAFYGVNDVRAVAVKLLARQDVLRRRKPEIRGDARQSEPGGSPVEGP